MNETIKLSTFVIYASYLYHIYYDFIKAVDWKRQCTTSMFPCELTSKPYYIYIKVTKL